MKNSLKIYLYEIPSAKTLNIESLSHYLHELLPEATITVRQEFTQHHKITDIDTLTREYSEARYRPKPLPILPGEIEYEKRILKKETLISGAVLYNSIGLHNIYRKLIPTDERELNFLHIIFTKRLFGDIGEDGRFHSRVILFGFPVLISTTGIVEAPAKPKEYYGLRRKFTNLYVAEETIKEKLAGRFIDYDDPRLTEVMKGYVLQAIFYHLFKEPFCADKDCRLFNAHWQEEVIHSQLVSGKICNKHLALLKNYESKG